MSMQYCDNCGTTVDTDYNAEHFDNEECHEDTGDKLVAVNHLDMDKYEETK